MRTFAVAMDSVNMAEQPLAERILPAVRPGTLVLADRGFLGRRH
jgi:hypothetical protein